MIIGALGINHETATVEQREMLTGSQILTDIKNKIYNKYRFFRIWFFLQRHKDFAFKPFFTNFNTIERIENYL